MIFKNEEEATETKRIGDRRTKSTKGVDTKRIGARIGRNRSSKKRKSKNDDEVDKCDQIQHSNEEDDDEINKKRGKRSTHDVIRSSNAKKNGGKLTWL